MTQSGYLFLGLTAIVAALAGVLAFAVAKFFAAARAVTKDVRKEGAETAFMAAALEDSLNRLRTQERAAKARAEASERLSSEIIASLTSGLLVVDQESNVRTLNPAGLTLLGICVKPASLALVPGLVWVGAAFLWLRAQRPLPSARALGLGVGAVVVSGAVVALAVAVRWP